MLMKKILVLLIAVLAGFTLNAQRVEILDSVSFNAIDPGDVEYVNMSVMDKLEIEGKSSALFDIGTADIPKDVDSFRITVNEKEYIIKEIAPFVVHDMTKSIDVDLVAFKGTDSLEFMSNESKELSVGVEYRDRPTFVQDTIVFGLLAIVLALIFFTSHKESKFWKVFYRIVPALLLCYLIPAVLDMLGLISKEYSSLYTMAKNYLLPGALILMTLGIDFKGILKLGPKAIIMFLTATVGIVVGGPLAIIVYAWIDPSVVQTFQPEFTGDPVVYDSAWRGFATLAGSWIGGGANQAAMLETYKYNPDLYGKMVTVDIVVANLWMAFLLWGAARANKFDKWLKADSSSIEELKTRVSDYQSSIAKVPTLTDYMVILGITFGIVAVAHFLGAELAGLFDPESPFGSSFFWLVVIATTGGLILSGTKLRKYEGAGASKLGSVFIYILVATIGMKMELTEAVKEPQLILVGIIWMLIHVGILFLVAKLIKAPFFFVAVGSKANVGGAASAPIVASAFHPSLAAVGALLAVLGYALGTYGAIACAEMMKMAAPILP